MAISDFEEFLSPEDEARAVAFIDAVKQRIAKEADGVISEALDSMYCDVLPWLETEGWRNMRGLMLTGLAGYGPLATDSRYQWEEIRTKIFEEHREALIDDRIKDLEMQIQVLQGALEIAREYR